MDSIDVSIVCLAYNHSRYIENAIRSFLMQKTKYSYEIIIHDDASTDGTQDIIKRYADRYPDIIVPIVQTENQYSKKIVITRTYVYPKARGRYIAICEGDDFWTDEDKIEIQISYMDSNPQCQLTAHAGNYCLENGDILNEKFRPYETDCKVPMRDICSTWLFPTASMVFRNTDNLTEIPFRGDPPCGDVPLVMYSGFFGEVYYFDRVMCTYRVGGVSSVSKKTGQSLKLLENGNRRFIQMLDRFDEFSGYLYNDYTDVFRTKKEFEILLSKGDIRSMKKPKYIELYKQLPGKRLVKIYLDKYCPHISDVLFTFYRKIKRKG